jgi:hypothetical protein
MSKQIEVAALADGTVIRHKTAGYTGRIDGTTAIRACFTEGGELLSGNGISKHTFQYRVAVAGEILRRIAPAEDLEILEQTARVICPSCGNSFQTKLGFAGKPRGRCQCGGWICPICLSCRSADEAEKKACASERHRLSKNHGVNGKTIRKTRSA